MMTLEKEKIYISIIIPVYNVEKYVSYCLKSVILQANDMVEVIVIDDGSTDGSKKVCENILSQGKLNIKFLHQENAGLSSTRNRGIDMANGEYIMFLDSDDELNLNAVQVLAESAKNHPDVDVFYFDAATVDEINDGQSRNKYNRKNKISGPAVFDAEEYFSEYYVDTHIVSACLCMIKREVLIANNIKFDEERLYEDNAFSLNLLLCSQKVCYLPYDLYVRRYRENSITTSKISEKNVKDACYVLERFIEMKNQVLAMNSQQACNAFLAEIYKIYFWTENMMLEAGMILECVSNTKSELIRALWEWPEKYKNCSYYFFIYTMVKGRAYNFIDNDYVKEKLNECYFKLLEEIQVDEDKRIAIYGRGKHTRLLLEMYEYMTGRELEFDVYADTYKENGYTQDGKKIVNIADIEKCADVIVVSSFVYRLEMLKTIRDLNLGIEVIDFYDIEKINLFDERPDFLGVLYG